MPRETRRTRIFSDTDSDSESKQKSSKLLSKLKVTSKKVSKSKLCDPHPKHSAKQQSCKAKSNMAQANTSNAPTSTVNSTPGTLTHTTFSISQPLSSTSQSLPPLTQQHVPHTAQSGHAPHPPNFVDPAQMQAFFAAFSSMWSAATQTKKGNPGMSSAPSFSGEGDDANSFIEKFRIYGSFHSWSDQDMLHAFPLSLKGPADIWFTTLNKSNINSFDQLINSFKERFLSPTSNWVLRQQLGQRTQGPNESVNIYSADIRRRCQRLDIPIAEQLHYFVQGLRPDLKTYVILQQPKTLDEAENSARIKESIPGPPSINVTTDDIVMMKQDLIKQLKQEHLEQNSDRDVHEQNTAAKQTDHNEYVRQIVREELQTANKNPSGQRTEHFDSRSDFRRPNRTRDGRIICFNCERPGHIKRYCHLRNFRQNEYQNNRQNTPRQDDYRTYEFRPNEQYQSNSFREYESNEPASDQNYMYNDYGQNASWENDPSFYDHRQNDYVQNDYTQIEFRPKQSFQQNSRDQENDPRTPVENSRAGCVRSSRHQSQLND